MSDSEPAVTLLNSTPNPEETVCRAARNDYSADGVSGRSFEDVMSTVDGETVEEKKETLIHHLLRHSHFGPFEHPQATFSAEGVSRSLMAQLTRHRHATFDVQSMRYVTFDEMGAGDAVVAIPELEDPGTPGRNASFSEGNKDLYDEHILEGRERHYTDAIKSCFYHYQELLDLGVAPENARMVLPIGTKINLVFSVNARMLMHIGDMRAAADSQWEIRELTEQVLDLAAEWMPVTFDYYESEMKGRVNRLSP